MSDDEVSADDEASGPMPEELASPRSRELMVEPWLWSRIDADSPFGCDTGADTWALFREWRSSHPSASPLRFLSDLLQSWDVSDERWSLHQAADVQARLEHDHFSMLTRDDAVIALAFSQLVLEGVIEPELQERALLAIQRQSMPEVMTFRGWTSAIERLNRLAHMRQVLSEA